MLSINPQVVYNWKVFCRICTYCSFLFVLNVLQSLLIIILIKNKQINTAFTHLLDSIYVYGAVL